MKLGSRLLVLLAAAFVLQVILGLPGAWPWATAILLPMPWVVGPPLLTSDRRWYVLSFFVGAVWDVLFEPVVGPGVISWSCAALMAWSYARVATDRSPRSWFVLGAAGSATVLLVRSFSLLPLGIGALPDWRNIGISVATTAVWCGFVGWLIAMDLPGRWRVYRARTLR